MVRIEDGSDSIEMPEDEQLKINARIQEELHKRYHDGTGFRTKSATQVHRILQRRAQEIRDGVKKATEEN